MELIKGKYYQCKKPVRFKEELIFKKDHEYIATGKFTLRTEQDADYVISSIFKDCFNPEPMGPPAPVASKRGSNTQNLPKDPAAKKTLAEEAYELIGGDRLEEYGDMRRSFENIGKVWSVLLGIEVSAEKVALMMVGLKMVRQNNKHKRDNLVDCIGYAVLLGRLEGEE